ncbi:hypothetical protein QYM36_018770, partial [Artemia franciscana]
QMLVNCLLSELGEVNYQRHSLVQLEVRQPIINVYTMLLHAEVIRPVEDGNINGVDMDSEDPIPELISWFIKNRQMLVNWLLSELDEVNYERHSLVQLEVRQPIINFYTMLLHAEVIRPVEDGNINWVDMDFEVWSLLVSHDPEISSI